MHDFLKTMGEPPKYKPESIKKWLDILGTGMFVVTLGPRKLGISKELLTYLEYNL